MALQSASCVDCLSRGVCATVNDTYPITLGILDFVKLKTENRQIVIHTDRTIVNSIHIPYGV